MSALAPEVRCIRLLTPTSQPIASENVHQRLKPSRVTPQCAPIERVVGFIKGGFSHRIGSKLPVWQRGFTDHRIRNEEEFQTRREYIYQNPVRARMVEVAALYPYSSAYRSESLRR